MDKEGYAYNLFLVPVPHTHQYEINLYQPQVEGSQWVGFFDKKKRAKYCLKPLCEGFGDYLPPTKRRDHENL
jgi:hypothetical protein